MNKKDNTWDIYKHENFFSDEFISHILMKLRLPKEDFIFVKETILSATNYFLLHKSSINREKPHYKEKQALEDFSKKAEEFKKSYEKLVDTGIAHFEMVQKSARNPEIFENKHPKSIEMWNLFCEGNKVFPKSITDFISILEELSKSAAPKFHKDSKEKPKKTPDSRSFETLAFNLAVLFKNSPHDFRCGTYIKKEKKYNASAVSIITQIAQKIDPDIKNQQMGNAIKNAAAQQNSRS